MLTGLLCVALHSTPAIDFIFFFGSFQINRSLKEPNWSRIKSVDPGLGFDTTDNAATVPLSLTTLWNTAAESKTGLMMCQRLTVSDASGFPFA